VPVISRLSLLAGDRYHKLPPISEVENVELPLPGYRKQILSWLTGRSAECPFDESLGFVWSRYEQL